MVVFLVVLTLLYLVNFLNLVSYITQKTCLGAEGNSFISCRDHLKTNLRFAFFYNEKKSIIKVSYWKMNIVAGTFFSPSSKLTQTKTAAAAAI